MSHSADQRSRQAEARLVTVHMTRRFYRLTFGVALCGSPFAEGALVRTACEPAEVTCPKCLLDMAAAVEQALLKAQDGGA